MLTSLDRDWILFRIRRLSGAQFEDLCRDLLSAEGHQDIQHFGAAGSEKGVDILSRTPDGRWLVTQCKQVASLGPKPAGEALQNVIDHPLDPPLQAFRIAAPINYTRATREKLQEIGGKDLEIEPAWDGPVLLDLLEKYHAIRDDRIGFIPGEAEIQKTLPFWNVPRRNDYFTGREDLLDELERRLEDEGSTALTQAITGLGGIGKTQIAIEYCHQQRSTFDGGVYWLDASSTDSLLAGYAELAVDLGKLGRDVPAEDAARAFLQHLAQSNGWLIVLDNVDEPDAIRQILPPTTGGQVLITTRARKPGLGKAKPLPVDIWSIDQATDFLLERATRDEFERPDAEQLAEALDGLPLALEQAGAFLAHHDLTIGEYLEDFQAVKLDLFDLQEPEEGNYEKTVATTWEISFHKIGQASGAAVEALEACAFLAPDRVPLELFTATEDRLGPHLGALARETTNSAISTKLIEPMTQYSLARFDNENREFSLHRLVQQVIHQRLRMSSRVASTCELVHGALNSTFPGRPQEAVNWAQCARWLPHVRFNVEHWPRESKANPTALWMSAGNYAWVTGRAREANFFFESALNERLRGLGEEHPDTLISMNDLAETLRAIGEFKAARKLHEDTLKVRQRVLGQEHQDTLTSMNNLAGTLKALGEAKEAKNLLEAALKVSQRTLGKEHPDTLTYMNNLAATLRVLGEGKEARNLHEHVLKGRQRSLGEKHSSTLTSMNNLASTLLALGEANEARKLLEDALKIRQLVLGEKHSSTLTSMNNLASTLLELGEANEARRLQEKALEVSQRELGHEHPDTLISMNNLAGTLKALGEVDEASRLLEDALNVSRRVRGRVHPDTLASIHNLCVLQVDTEGMDLDLDLLIELLQNVFKLPSGTPILMTVIDYWIPQTHNPD